MRTVLGKDIKTGMTHWYHEEEMWTASENSRVREGHENAYGLSLNVEKPNGTCLRISVGREEPFLMTTTRETARLRSAASAGSKRATGSDSA